MVRLTQTIRVAFAALLTLGAPMTSWADRAAAVPAGCSLAALPGLSAQHARAIRSATTPWPLGASVATATIDVVESSDFWRVAKGIAGMAVDSSTLAELPCGDAVRSRDQLVWSLGLAGYSAREIGDVLEGAATVEDLNQAQFRRMAGVPPTMIADFLDGRRRALLEPPPKDDTSGPAMTARPAQARIVVGPISSFEAELNALANFHRVSPVLVRAVITAESNWNPRAVSYKGAVGLMQLMPATARYFGVDPWHPVDNLRGGIAYLGSLLKLYRGNARLALIAYHAGPSHANRVRDGRTRTNSQTRRYLSMVAAAYPLR